MIPPGGRLTVPTSPSTNSSAPCQPMKPARVTTNDGRPTRVITRPWNAPMSAPAHSVMRIASPASTWWSTYSTPRIAPQSPLTMPTDRSISPTSSTMNRPTAIVPTAAICRARFDKFCGDRKRSFWVCKMVQMTAKPRITGSRPRSPCRTRPISCCGPSRTQLVAAVRRGRPREAGDSSRAASVVDGLVIRRPPARRRTAPPWRRRRARRWRR